MENRKFDVTALGELLIDFTENGSSSQGNPVMEANPACDFDRYHSNNKNKDIHNKKSCSIFGGEGCAY